MPEIKEVTAMLDRLIALPKFENIRFGCSVTMSVGENEKPEDVYKEAMAQCRLNIIGQIERFQEQ